MRHPTRLLLGLLMSLILAGCNATDHTFCSLPAYFAVENTLQVPALHGALNNMGQFCTIRATGGQYVFADTRQSSAINITQLDYARNFYPGLSGFIVGLPNIPEMGLDQSRVVCYDWACRNCYEAFNVTRRMELQENGYAHCSGCGRTYNLNDMGQAVQGEAGKPLYRYRISFMGYTMLINNR